jgi:hypothetical protein
VLGGENWFVLGWFVGFAGEGIYVDGKYCAYMMLDWEKVSKLRLSRSRITFFEAE